MRYAWMRSFLACAVASIAAVAQPSEWTRLMDRGDSLDRDGRFQEAALVYQSALRLAEACRPSDRRFPLTLNRLALTYDELGRFSDAVRLYQRALTSLERTEGRSTADYAAVLNNLSAVYVGKGEFAKAEPLIREALATDEALLPPDDPVLAKARSVLADVLTNRGKYLEAGRLLAQAIQVFENRSDNRRDLGYAKNNMGVVCHLQKQDQESRRLLEEGLALIESDTGPGHPALARLLSNLAGTYAALGLRDQADAAFLRSIQIAETRFGPDHPIYGVMLHNYAGFLRGWGRKSQAKALEARSREALQQSARRNGVGMTVDVSAFHQK